MFTKAKHFCALYLRVFPHSIAPAAFSACLCSAPVHPKPQLLASSVIFPNLLQPPPAGPGAGGRPRGPFCRRRGWRGAGSREMAAVRCRPRAGSGLMAVGSVSPTCAVLYVPDPFMCTAHGVPHRAGSLDTCLCFSLACSKPLSSFSSVFPLMPYVLTSENQKQQSPMPLSPAGHGVLLKPSLKGGRCVGAAPFGMPSPAQEQARHFEPGRPRPPPSAVCNSLTIKCK